jgi:hypothetical protein
LENTPDLYLDELREELKAECGVSVSLSTIWRTLVHSGYSMKKVCICLIYIILFLTASSTSSSLKSQLNAVRKNRANLQHSSGLMKPTNLCSLMRVQLTDKQHIVEGPELYMVEKLLEKKAFFCCGQWYICSCGAPWYFSNDCLLKRFSVLPTMALNGIIHCDIVEGAFDTKLFYTFISHLLDMMEHFPAPNSVIIMDNCQIHKHPNILELIESK